MIAIIVVGIILYSLIETKFEIEPYEDKSSKRVKRMSKGLIYFLMSVAFFFLKDKYSNLNIPWIVTVVLWIGNWISAINHYLNYLCISLCVYGGIGYSLWYYFYDKHKVLVTIGLIFFGFTTVCTLMEVMSKIKHGCDRDEDEAKEEEEKKQKRFNKMFLKIILKIIK